MKYLLIILLFFATSSQGQSLLADSVIQKNALQNTLFFLSIDSLKGRLTGTEGANIAASFIAASFDSIGLKPGAEDQQYFDHYIADYDGKKIPAKNVVGFLPGKFTNDTVVIFSAHYDHIGQKGDMPDNKETTGKDIIFNGANDNATGVTALIGLATYYKALNNNRYMLLFVAFSGEEMGLLGSEHLAEKMKPGAVKALINLEMLGRPVSKSCFVIAFNSGRIRNMLNQSLNTYSAGGQKKFFITDPYPDQDLFHRSDHYPFTRRIKNAFTIMGSSPEDIYYHSVGDEFATIDIDFLLQATKNIALACEVFIQ